ncbi:MAG: efflux RND transporter periplasmic adaptor subunit [Candidatus Eisenbacteria bacterium]|nr:efflux RND transporter periplasmic adaptor subunit [Candidatus Eisenbacteria bacterium]
MKKLWIAVAAVVVVAVVILAMARGRGTGGDSQYTFGEVTRGDLKSVVSATGALSAVGTVEVGTQVSGTLARIFVDFNDDVRAGQVLAVLDTTMLATSVKDARAGVLRAQSQLDKARLDQERIAELFAQDLISKADYETAATALTAAQAGLVSAQASLERARANLAYAVIRSPIDGTVIERSIELGQTVAASLSAPKLFVIAEDLSKMEIHALVDESDMGQIKVGQRATFTVEAHPGSEFAGTVKQVRLLPQTVSNVVSYTVVLDAANEGDLLLPGMTATVDFIVEERKDVLLVPSAALRIRPTEQMFAEARASTKREGGEAPGGGTPTAAGGASKPGGGSAPAAGSSPPSAGARGGMFAHGNASDRALVWYLNEQGKLAFAPVTRGATDGRNTEIGEGPLKEGMQVIVALPASAAAATAARTNPLTPTSPFGRRR